MKRIIITALAPFILLGTAAERTVTAAERPEVSARGAVLISADTGEIVFSENFSEKLPMASTTKIMTTLLCLESGGLYDEFVVDSDAIHVEGSSMGLVEGDTVTMKRSGSGGGLLRPASPEEAVPELLMQLSAILYSGGPAVFPAEETLRASHALGQIFVLTMSPERLTCRKLLDRLPENRLCLIAHGAAEAHPVYRVVERRALLA